jgi:S-methyl-5-thioribose-1-phosphate isomerase
MRVNGKHYTTVWMEGSTVCLIEQNRLPFSFEIYRARSCDDTCRAIKEMLTRGAGAIGCTAAFAMAQGFLEAPDADLHAWVRAAKAKIEATRPTAQNLFYATNYVYSRALDAPDPRQAAVDAAKEVLARDSADSRKIGEFGAALIQDGWNIATHCNAGWLAFSDYGTALSPIYLARDQGKKIFVYADETRPRSQGGRLTAWELHNEEIPHTIIPDNATAALMAAGKIQMMIVGADRIAANGDVANKIGTLEKAVCAAQFGVPFYVAAPTTTFDASCHSGADIPIEERSPDEVHYITGPDEAGVMRRIRITAPDSPAYNPAFDVTPARFITGIITEKGIIKANRDAIQKVLS